MKEEDFIQNLKSDKNPFRTPDGYFEGFTARMMERIQQEGLTTQQTTAKRVEMSPWRKWMRYSAAAVVAGVCVAAGTYLYVNRDSSQLYAVSDQNTIVLTDEELDEALNYEMKCGILDNHQIEYYLTEAY